MAPTRQNAGFSNGIYSIVITFISGLLTKGCGVTNKLSLSFSVLRYISLFLLLCEFFKMCLLTLFSLFQNSFTSSYLISSPPSGPFLSCFSLFGFLLVSFHILPLFFSFPFWLSLFLRRLLSLNSFQSTIILPPWICFS